jgi:hypothetical protein
VDNFGRIIDGHLRSIGQKPIIFPSGGEVAHRSVCAECRWRVAPLCCSVSSGASGNMENTHIVFPLVLRKIVLCVILLPRSPVRENSPEIMKYCGKFMPPSIFFVVLCTFLLVRFRLLLGSCLRFVGEVGSSYS